MKRYYGFGADELVLIAIDGAGNRHAVHDPMYCFRGAGWRIWNKTVAPVEGGEALLLQLEKYGRIRETAYWFSNGRQRHISVMRYWFQATLRRITLGRSDKEPVLIMLQSVEDHPLNLGEVLDQFGVLFDI
ncbi:MAG TPA: exosortase-associated EpsI family protein [Deltaproteobacteria bacterium]|nr:exosortase-associated EpsI family protein [Deltaproteobacteria bacterium]